MNRILALCLIFKKIVWLKIRDTIWKNGEGESCYFISRINWEQEWIGGYFMYFKWM